MIRVLHTESSMNMGGQELRILMEMEGLVGRGFESVLAARPGSRILDEALDRGLKAYPVKMRGSVDPLAILSFIETIKKEKVDLLNAHGSKDGWSAGIAARLLCRKVVRSRHVANPVRGHFFGRLVYGPLCDRIVTTSESIRSGMAEKGIPAEKIVSIPTGVDTGRFHPGVSRGKFRAEYGISGDVPLVGMVSVLRGDKGPDIFIRAADAVLGKLPNAVFALVGDGWMRAELEGMVNRTGRKAGIIMTGYLRDVPSALADFDIMVLPARVPEGVPQAVLQAHAMKVPVIASEVGGITEVAIPGRTALCVPPGDHAALAEAIIKSLADKAGARNLAEEGYRLVRERYTLDVMLDRMAALYKEVL